MRVKIAAIVLAAPLAHGAAQQVPEAVEAKGSLRTRLRHCSGADPVVVVTGFKPRVSPRRSVI
jgi:hypothetical protein